MTDPIRLVVANDFEVVVHGLAAMLEPFADRVVVTFCAAGSMPRTDSDIVLYDTFGAPWGTVLDVERALSDFRAQRLVILTWDVASVLADDQLPHGVSAVVSASVDATGLVEVLEDVWAGRGPVLREDPIADPEGGDWPGKAEGLTVRESEIIALIVQGLSNQEVADHAYLSINTVKSYIRTAYRKMNVSTRSQALLWGIEHGFRAQSARRT